MTRTITFEAGGIAVADDLAAVRERIVERLLFAQGEWYLDADAGIPYIDLLGKSLDTEIIAQEIGYHIEQVSGVNAARHVAVSVSGQELSVDMTCDTDYGPLSLEVRVGDG